MDALDLFVTLEKLYLIAKGLNKLLEDEYSTLNTGSGCARKRVLCTVVTGVSELHHDLEALAMSDRLERSFPVDNA